MAQLALDVAPAAGVDVRQIGFCWLLVANGCVVKNDFPGAYAAMEKMKELAPDLYERAMPTIKEQEEKHKASKKPE